MAGCCGFLHPSTLWSLILILGPMAGVCRAISQGIVPRASQSLPVSVCVGLVLLPIK